MKRCQTCGEKIADAATVCPRCQQRQSFMGAPGQMASSGVGMGAGRGGGGIGVGLIAVVAFVLVGAGAAGFVFVRSGETPAPLARPSSPAAVVVPALPKPVATPPPPPHPESFPPGIAEAVAATCSAATRSARFAAVVEKRLGRPAGFEVVRTTIGPVDDDTVTMILSYRASTASGAPRNGVAIGKVDLLSCAVTINVMA